MKNIRPKKENAVPTGFTPLGWRLCNDNAVHIAAMASATSLIAAKMQVDEKLRQSSMAELTSATFSAYAGMMDKLRHMLWESD